MRYYFVKPVGISKFKVMPYRIAPLRSIFSTTAIRVAHCTLTVEIKPLTVMPRLVANLTVLP